MTVSIKRIAKRLHDECFEAHRGAFWLDEGRRVAVAFGNDGYSKDSRSKAEVEAVRRHLAEAGGKEEGFATAGNGYTWALACMLPSGQDPDTLEDVLWATWNANCKLMGAKEPELAWKETIERTHADGVRALMRKGA